MPRRKSVVRPRTRVTTPEVTGDNYWTLFLTKRNFVGATTIKKAVEPKTVKDSDFSPEQVLWIGRVAEALCPSDGVTEAYLPEVLQNQRQTKQGLADVLQGRIGFDTWIGQARKLGKKTTRQLWFILYKALEGLTSEEAIQMREAYAAQLAQYDISPAQAMGGAAR